MLKCGTIKGTEQCVLFSADGSKVLGKFPYSEHGGEKGARAAAHKREGQVQHFKAHKSALVDAVEEFGGLAVLKYTVENILGGCEDCEDVAKAVLELLDAGGQDIEKARRSKRRRITIEDEEDDDDDERKEPAKEPGEEERPPEEVASPEGEKPRGEEGPRGPVEEGEEKAGEGEEERDRGPMAQGAGEKGEEEGLAQDDGSLPEGWTPESLQKYWQSLGGTVESCVQNAPKTAKDPQRFCARLQAKIQKVGGGGEPEKPQGPAQPMQKSVDEVLEALARLVAKVERDPGYAGEVGWDDPPSWLKAGTPDVIRQKVWKAMGSSHHGCVAKVQGKVDDPGRFCAALKDKMLGTTMWRGKKKGEEKSMEAEGLDVMKYIEWILADEDEVVEKDVTVSVETGDGAETATVPQGDLMFVNEDGGKWDPDEEDGDEEESTEKEIVRKPAEPKPFTFKDFVRGNHAQRQRASLGQLADRLEAEEA